VTRSRGQALTEFLVTATLLVPLLAAVVVVGRLQDVRSAAQEAARYAAFGAALADGSNVHVENEVRARFFDAPERRLSARDRSERADPEANAHWRDLATGEPMIGTAADVSVALTNGAPPGVAARALDVAAAAADGASALTGGRFDGERAGFRSARVSVRLAGTDTLRSLQVSPPILRARADVFGDAWNASSPAQVAQRVESFVPAARLRALRPAVAPIAWALGLLEPAFGRMCLGRVDVELVPVDRLGAPGSGDYGPWVAPCY
jgi:hypothetical protein